MVGVRGAEDVYIMPAIVYEICGVISNPASLSALTKEGLTRLEPRRRSTRPFWWLETPQSMRPRRDNE